MSFLLEPESFAPLAPSLSVVRRLTAPILAGRKVVRIERLTGGLRNSHFKLRVERSSESLVLRFYDADPSVCRKEVRLLELVRKTVPVPEVLLAEPDGVDGSPPFVVLSFVPGVTLRELKTSGHFEALREVSFAVGAALAAIGRFGFADPGRLGDDLEAAGPFVEGPHPIPTFLDACLASPRFQSRAAAEIVSRLHELGGAWRGRLASPGEERRLVHGDFNMPNLLAREVDGKWGLAAVLDWEFSFSGSPLFDVGNFLRYEKAERPLLEPGFSRGFVEHGGSLPEDWKRLARVIDLTSLCEMLAREALPEPAAEEINGLIRATLDDRDPPGDE